MERTKIGNLDIKNLIDSNSLFKMKDCNIIEKAIISIDEILSRFKSYDIEFDDYQRVKNGNTIFNKDLELEDNTLIKLKYRSKTCALAFYKNNILFPKKVFYLKKEVFY